jgi:hypothetical protein
MRRACHDYVASYCDVCTFMLYACVCVCMRVYACVVFLYWRLRAEKVAFHASFDFVLIICIDFQRTICNIYVYVYIYYIYCHGGYDCF